MLAENRILIWYPGLGTLCRKRQSAKRKMAKCACAISAHKKVKTLPNGDGKCCCSVTSLYYIALMPSNGFYFKFSIEKLI